MKYKKLSPKTCNFGNETIEPAPAPFNNNPADIARFHKRLETFVTFDTCHLPTLFRGWCGNFRNCYQDSKEKTSGNLGIGTTTPGEILHVIGNVNVSGVFKGDADGSATAPIYTYYNDTNTGEFSPLPDTSAFTTGGTERVRIDSSGNLGIGTTSPQTKLHLVNSGGEILRLDGGSSSFARQYFYSGDATVAGVFNRGTGSTAKDIYFGETADTGKYIFRSSGALTIEGNVGIGTTTPASLLTVQGTFNATSSSTQMLLNSNGDMFINLRG